MKRVSAYDAALLAAGGGLMFLGLSHIDHASFEYSSTGLGFLATPASLASIGGAAIVVYAAWRIKPTMGAALGAIMLTAGYVNEHRKSLGLPEIPIPGIAFHA
jgi:hypothetical protein